MTTLTQFQPSPQAPFQFQATLDGAVYTIFVTWNVFGQRWYINIYDQNNNLILCSALVSSPSGLTISSASWALGTVSMTTTIPHGYKIGETVSLSIAGMLPAAYNGQFDALIIGPSTFDYPLTANPGSATILGTVGYNISLVTNYFTSTLVFREATQMFEVSP